MTHEQEKTSQRNHYHAKKYFIAIGAIPKDVGKWQYAMHHKDENLLHTDIERYIQWNIEDLEVVPFGKHSEHHSTGAVFTDERRKHISESNKEYQRTHDNSFKGKKHTEESKRRISEAKKGRTPWNKGLKYKIVDGKSVLDGDAELLGEA